MPPHLQKRIALFYLGGVLNVFLGLYVLIEGASFMPREKAMWIVLFFFVFAGVDFWFPYAIRRKWRAEQEAQRSAGTASGDGGTGQN